MSALHFLRPEYLLLLLPAWSLVWWFFKQQSDEKKWMDIIKPKMLKHLLVSHEQGHSRIAAPWHLAVVLTLLIVVLSGPSWKLKDSYFAQDDTKIALLLSVKKSMLNSDIMPNRLKRSTFKISNLLAQRKDTQSTLIAYSGTAHVILPLTHDHSIIKTFAQALSPKIMPVEGDNIQEALLLAEKELSAKASTIIVLTDAVSPSLVKSALTKGFDKATNVIFWQIATNELSNSNDFKSASAMLNAHHVAYSRDNSDVTEVSSLIDKNFKNAAQDEKDRYEDGGFYLLPIIFILLLLWARQGFMAELWRRR